MKELIEDLLTYSRSTFNAEKHEEVDLNKVIEEVLMLLNEESVLKKESIITETLPVILGISFQLKQLFFNLIDNSIKYKHPERDLELRVKCELTQGRKLSVQYIQSNKLYYKISVIDNGIGFDAEYAGKIFEIFQRLNNSPGTKGSGIGLAICKKIVQNHKGFIEATGKKNEGACISIFIPKD
jgi:signal transduction histidine kinase